MSTNTNPRPDGPPWNKIMPLSTCFVRCQPCSESSLIIQISIKLAEKVLYSSLTSFLPSCRYNHDWRGIWNETCWRGRREKVSATYLALPPTIDLQVDSGGRGLWLGWLWFGYSNILLSCPVDSAKFSTAQAETGRQRNDQYHSQPNPVRDGATTMVILYCVCLMISFPPLNLDVDDDDDVAPFGNSIQLRKPFRALRSQTEERIIMSCQIKRCTLSNSIFRRNSFSQRWLSG